MMAMMMRCVAFLLLIGYVFYFDQCAATKTPANDGLMGEAAQHGHEAESERISKRCHEDIFDGIVGRAINPKFALPLAIKRRDLQCEYCKSLCKDANNCHVCDKFCPVTTTTTTTTTTTLPPPLDDNKLQLASRMNQQQDGLQEEQERYYSVGAFGPGPMQTLMARLLHIPATDDLDRLIVLAKNKSKNGKRLPHPVVIDTAHVFTRNNGRPTRIDLELHNVEHHVNDDDINNLSKQLNKELDAAIDIKKRIMGDSHLNPEDIDKIIEHVLRKHNKKGLSPAVGAAAPNDDDDDAASAPSSDSVDDKAVNRHKAMGGGNLDVFDKDDIVGDGRSAMDEILESKFHSTVDNANEESNNNAPTLEGKHKKGKKGKKGMIEEDGNGDGLDDVALQSKHKQPETELDNNGEAPTEQQQRNDDDTAAMLESKHKKPKKGHGGNRYLVDDDDNKDAAGDAEKLGMETVDDATGSTHDLDANDDDVLGTKHKKHKKKKKGGSMYGGYDGGYYREHADASTAAPNQEHNARDAYQQPEEEGGYDNQSEEDLPIYAQVPEYEMPHNEYNSYQPPRPPPQPQSYGMQQQPFQPDSYAHHPAQGQGYAQQPAQGNGYAQQVPDDGYMQQNEYEQPSLEPVPMEEDLPQYAQLPEDEYYVGAKPSNKQEQAMPMPEDPTMRESWFEKEYNKLRSWISDNVQMTARPEIDEANRPLVDKYTKLIDEDLHGGKTSPEINSKISKLVEEDMNKDIPEPKMAEELDDIEKMIDNNDDDGKKTLVTLPNMKDFLTKLDDKSLLKAKNSLLGDKLKLPTIAPSRGAPFIDSKLLELKPMKTKTIPEFFAARAQKQNIAEKAEQDPNAELNQRMIVDDDVDDTKVGDGKQTIADGDDDTVGCSKESSEETMYIRPIDNIYGNFAQGGYRDSNKGLIPSLDKLLHPKHALDGILTPSHHERKDEDKSKSKDANQELPDLIKNLEKLRVDLPSLPTLRPHHQHTTTAPTTTTTTTTTPPPPPQPEFIPQQAQFMPQQPEFIPQNEFGPPPPPMHNFPPPNFVNPNQPPPPMNFQQFPQQQQQARSHHGRSSHRMHPLLGSRNLANDQNDMTHFGKIVPAELHDLHNRDVSEQMEAQQLHNMYFVGDGIKLPIHLKKHSDGTLHLSVDVQKLCKCNETNCQHQVKHLLDHNLMDNKVVGASRIVADEEEVPLGVVLNADDDANQSASVTNEDNDDEKPAVKKTEVKKRSPARTFKHTPDSIDDDYVQPIRKDFSDVMSSFNDNVHKYQANENKFIRKEYESSEPAENVQQQRVAFFTDVLSLMKDIALDTTQQQ